MDTLARTDRPLKLSAVALLAITFVVVGLGMGVAGEGAGPADAGNDLDDATEIGVGSWPGTIFRNATDEDVADYYRFPYEEGSVVEARALLEENSSTHLDVYLRVFDRERNQVVAFELPRLGAEEGFASLTNDLVDGPDYYFAITWDGSSLVEFSINYTLSVNQSDFAQEDAMTLGDVSRDYLDAYPLAKGEWTGSVGGPDMDWEADLNSDGGDMYRLTPEEGLFIKVSITLDWKSDLRDRNLVMSLENSTGGVLDLVIVSEEGRTEGIRFFPHSLDPLYVNVTSTAVINNYTLEITTQVPGADGDGNADAGEDPDHAMDLDRPVMPGKMMRGHGAEDLADYFELSFTSSGFVEVTLTLRSGTASPSNVVFRVVDHTKAEFWNFTMSSLDEPKRFAALTNSLHPTLRYYFGVTWEGAENVPFEFRYELASAVGPSQDDASTGEDVTNTTNGAPAISLDTPVKGTVGGTNPQWGEDLNADGADVYEVQPTGGAFVVVKATLDTFEGARRVGFDLMLLDQAGNLLVGPLSLFEVGDEEGFKHYVGTSLPVYVLVSSESESCDYTVLASLEEPPDIDLYIPSMAVTPSKPEPDTEVVITVVVASTIIIEEPTEIRVEVFVGGNKLAEQDVIFDNSDQEAVTFTWTAPSSSTDVTAYIDTLNAIPWESDKTNNEMTIHVEVGTDDGDDDGDDSLGMMFWVLILVGVIAVVILGTVAYVVFGDHDAEDEEPEDY